MSVLLTRPAAENAEIAAALARRGIETLAWPLTRIVASSAPIELPPDCAGLLITSANGLRAFAGLCPERALPVLAVGRRTAELARALGFAEAESADGDATALVQLARTRGLSPLFHPRGADQRVDLAEALGAHGIVLYAAVVYSAEQAADAPAAVLEAMRRGSVDIISLWSRRNACLFSNFLARHPEIALAPLYAVTISDAAAGPLRSLGFGRIIVATRPERDAMIEAIAATDGALRR